MFKFLQALFNYRSKKVTVIMWEDNFPDEPVTHQFKPKSLFIASVGALVMLTFLVIILFRYTPLGMIIMNYEEFAIRNDVIHVSERLIALQDSIERRESQLAGIRDVIMNRVDTNFIVGVTRDFTGLNEISAASVFVPRETTSFEFLNNPDLNFSRSSLGVLGFPVAPPVRGTQTKSFEPQINHYGIDIAASDGDPVKTIGDGVILSAEWTINYGFVVLVQHTRGFVSVYKHMRSPKSEKGDFVQKGTILGVVSNGGTLSTGPHLHFELWQNGRPIDPVTYLLD
jgi:murein DD-endopeptidase MepM/ murein hydrolase activator NlpD